MKTCSKCGEEKPLDGFYRRKSAKDGHRTNCKQCMDRTNRQYYQANKERMREWYKQYYEANKEREIERSKQYYEANKERMRERQRRWIMDNPEAHRKMSELSNKKQIDKLSDGYVKHMLKKQIGITKPPQELIDLKRLQLQIHRVSKDYERK